MALVGGLILGSAVIGGVVASESADAQRDAQRAAQQAQQQGADEAIAEQRRQFDIAQELTAPRREAEDAALAQLSSILGIGGQAPDFSGIDIPGQQFAIDEASQAITRQQSALGGLQSGNTLAALQERALGITNQNFLSNFLQPLTTLATGQAGQQAGQQALNLGFNVGGIQQQAGANRANIVGQPVDSAAGIGAAVQGGLSNLLLLNALGGGGGGGIPSDPTGAAVSARAGQNILFGVG